jgi:hypothetical protein
MNVQLLYRAKCYATPVFVEVLKGRPVKAQGNTLWNCRIKNSGFCHLNYSLSCNQK